MGGMSPTGTVPTLTGNYEPTDRRAYVQFRGRGRLMREVTTGELS